MEYTLYTGEASSTLIDPAGPVPSVSELRSRWRARMLPDLHGDVLDIGAGEGHSLRYLPGRARLTCVEPHRESARRLQALAQRRGRATVIRARAERLPLSARSVDTAVCCAVLCSVSDPDRVLAEVHRVLRPGGRAVILEHVIAPRGSWLRTGQRVAAPLSRCLDRGCDPARDTEAALRRSALTVVDLHRIAAQGPWGLTFPHLAAVLTRERSDV